MQTYKKIETNVDFEIAIILTNSLTEMINHYIYLLIEREFLNTGEPIYKIGRTRQNPPWKRFDQYPKNSHLIMLNCVNDSILVETQIKKQLIKTQGIKHRKDIGVEYFEGSLDIIKKICLINCYGNQSLEPDYPDLCDSCQKKTKGETVDKIDGLKQPYVVLKADLKYIKNNEDAQIAKWIDLNLFLNNEKDQNGDLPFIQMKNIFGSFKQTGIYNRKIKKKDLQSMIEKKYNINCKKFHYILDLKLSSCFVGLTWNNKKDAHEGSNQNVYKI